MNEYVNQREREEEQLRHAERQSLQGLRDDLCQPPRTSLILTMVVIYVPCVVVVRTKAPHANKRLSKESGKKNAQ